MTRARQSLGKLGEQLAAEKLAAAGYEIVARNFRCRGGELDLVTRRGAVWVFVEVRARRGAGFGTPEESLTPRKRRHLLTAAQTYLQENQLENVDWRVDFVAVELAPDGVLLRVEIVENILMGG